MAFHLGLIQDFSGLHYSDKIHSERVHQINMFVPSRFFKILFLFTFSLNFTLLQALL